MDKLMEWINGERGRQAKLASALGITHSAIYQWGRVPGERLVAVSRITNIPMEDLRPDLFEGRETAA